MFVILYDIKKNGLIFLPDHSVMLGVLFFDFTHPCVKFFASQHVSWLRIIITTNGLYRQHGLFWNSHARLNNGILQHEKRYANVFKLFHAICGNAGRLARDRILWAAHCVILEFDSTPARNVNHHAIITFPRLQGLVGVEVHFADNLADDIGLVFEFGKNCNTRINIPKSCDFHNTEVIAINCGPGIFRLDGINWRVGRCGHFHKSLCFGIYTAFLINSIWNIKTIKANEKDMQKVFGGMQKYYFTF